jgi:predicted secreted protein
MKSAGASTEAMAFVREFASNGLAYVRAFRDTGRVDIAYIEYLFRANDLDGVLLVNGTPPIIDVDDYKFLSPDNLRKNADYAALLEKYPTAAVFPSDRYNTDLPVAIPSTKRGLEFQVDYLIQDGCHACARIGTLVADFPFDSSGKFREARVVGVRPVESSEEDRPVLSRRSEGGPPENAKEGKLDAMEIHSKVGSSFTIVLSANHTTGYSWRLSKPLNADLFRRVSAIYEEGGSERIGAGGKEMWTFEALSAGTAEIEFEYARPWEKDAAPVNTAKYEVEIK